MKDRFVAAALHLLLSAALILGSTGFIVFHFYPGLLAELMDVTDLLQILIPVDIIVGPLLTFIIYRKGKKGLKLDLTLIIICQLLALAYGNWNAYKSRPGYLVFYHDAFFIASPGIPQDAVPSDLQVKPWSSPHLVETNLNIDIQAKMKLVESSLASGIPVHFTSQYFRPFNEASPQLLTQRSLPLAKVRQRPMDAETQAQLETLVQSGKKLAFFPLIYAQSNKIIVVDTDTRELLASLDGLKLAVKKHD